MRGKGNGTVRDTQGKDGKWEETFAGKVKFKEHLEEIA
jgi:hypothetical protein